MENLKQIPAVGFSESLRRLSAGGDLWTVYEMDRAVFSCWIFRNRTPVFAARDGWLDLPPETVCLEDSMTLSSYRGKGIASATWSEIAAVLAHEGVSRIITKIEEQNGSARRGVEKTGFREVASMQFVRFGPASHVEVQPQGGSGVAEFLVERLAH
jgi:GNAT superfamily N-acetyltransferase